VCMSCWARYVGVGRHLLGVAWLRAVLSMGLGGGWGV
jgi:hypothetical protein